jgi:hypothetical protein
MTHQFNPAEILPIDDKDLLYRRLKFDWWDEKKRKIKSCAFSSFNASVDWARFSTKEESFERRSPDEDRVAQVQAEIPRQAMQQVKHDPDLLSGNYSHSLISGDKRKASVRRHIARNSKVVFPLSFV